MTSYKTLQKSDLQNLRNNLETRYAGFKSQNLKLDMTRGKPSPAQLDLATELLELPGKDRFRSEDGTDARNYGGLDGLPEMKALFAQLLKVEPAEVIIGGNGSLAMMHDAVLRAMVFGAPGGEGPWNKTNPRFLCPVPGYDRHFSICEHLGIEMIPVALGDTGPHMKEVQQLASSDPSIKGIWCVPRYSNPTGCIYSDATVDELAQMKTAAPDFRIFWDDAYAVHHLGTGPAPLKSILAAAKAAGNEDRPLIFGSTSKISFAGAGIAAMAGSKENLDDARRHLSIQTIGPDKLNQLRHILFFKDLDGILAHMERHAKILKPRFDAVEEGLRAGLSGKEIATWTKPTGGYFVSLDTIDGCAKRVVALAGEAGVKMTPAGATFPLRNDPRDRNIRIAPSLPSLDEIHQAIRVLTVCIELASVEKLLSA